MKVDVERSFQVSITQNQGIPVEVDGPYGGAREQSQMKPEFVLPLKVSYYYLI